MNAPIGLRFLRPYLYNDIKPVKPAAYVRLFAATSCRGFYETHRSAKNSARSPEAINHARDGHEGQADHSSGGHYETRVKKLQDANALQYPRISGAGQSNMTAKEFHRKHGHLREGPPVSGSKVSLCGRVTSVRIMSKKFFFMSIVADGVLVQNFCKYDSLLSGVTHGQFNEFTKLVQRGDIVSITGEPYRSSQSYLTVSSFQLPEILTPGLSPLPTKLEDPETRISHRHIDLLVNSETADTMRLRSHVIQFIRNFLLKDDFLEFQTPIIAGTAGGAIARPFTTTATEFPKRQLSLRVAPELWLKRLIIGGMDRVFEIGPAFRNEGLDATHNPEFTTCEFYKAYAGLEELISMTEKMISGLVEHAMELRSASLPTIPEFDTSLYKAPFKRLAFIPTVESSLGEALPDLSSEDATSKLLALFTRHSINPPSSPTLPRLLDKLCSLYIEPHCNNPIFITHHPACLAPLAKSFRDPTSKQLVSARVELFIQHKEIANMYEEENSPFEQKQKFVEQIKFKDEENKANVDDNYVKALRTGLPPTGGWGAGIDRLVMLLSGSARINDVLPFGNLRNVVNLGGDTKSSE